MSERRKHNCIVCHDIPAYRETCPNCGRSAENDLAICAAKAPGPVAWQKFGGAYHLAGQYGMRPIILSTYVVEREGFRDEAHLSNRDAERDVLMPLKPEHPDSIFIKFAWNFTEYWIKRAQEAEAEINHYQKIVGDVSRRWRQAHNSPLHERTCGKCGYNPEAKIEGPNGKK